MRAGDGPFRIAALVLGLLVALAGSEAVLRLIGFSFALHPTRVEFGWPTPEVIEDAYLPDADLFWVTRDYPEQLAAAREAPAPEVVFLGDSCTQFSDYDERFAGLVRHRRGRELRTLNVGVGGWSSYQGLRQLERDILPLKPRVVSIYYGWNDHWIGLGLEDEGIAEVSNSSLQAWRGLRLVQLWTKLRVGSGWPSWDAAGEAPARAPAELPLRVPEPAFRSNLRTMVALARAGGAQPLLLTAPSAHLAGSEPSKFADRHIQDLSQLVPLHQRYVRAVRETAAETGAALCDLAATLDPPRDGRAPGDAAALFWDDGIHLSQFGSARVARALYACFEASGLFESEASAGMVMR